MKQILFATVGTTSFDQFIKSVCSTSFIIATLHTNNPRPPSDPPASSLQSISDPQLLWPSCEILHCSKSSRCTPSSSEFSQQSSFTNLDKIAMLEVDREIVIQYGRGTCPAQFFPSEIGRAVDGGTFDDEGFISMRFLNDSKGAANHFILLIRWYRFKPSLKTDMERANLILCHAGAGTLLEALSLSNPSDTTSSTHRVINAVINTELMDNHQSELAEELEKRNHILVTKDVDEWATLRGAESFWKGVNDFVPSPFFGGSSRIDSASGEGRVSNFQQIVDRVIGI